jgi:predicted acyltransferase
MSLDVFRGATIASMMLVNNPGNWGAIYKPLEHAEWHGWTFTDLVFPFFLWIVGVAIPLSTARRLEQGHTRSQLLLHAFRRSLIIFALGFFLNSFTYLIDGSLFSDGFSAGLHNYLTSVRIPGVLQRIGICYFITCLVFLFANLRGQIITIAVLLSGYWVLMMLVPVPGQGAGVLEKGNNFSQYLDNLILNGSVIGTHVWKVAKTWDPEGIFSTLPAIASCLFGVMTGQLLRSKQLPAAKTAWMFVAGNLLIFAGLIMDAWLPINKNLWTSSYAVFMAGMAGNCFAVCYWLIDVQGWRTWAKPFAIYGMNAITVFVLAGILGRISLEVKLGGQDGHPLALKTWLYEHTFAQVPEPKVASLLWALFYVLLLYLVAYVMYRKKWFIKV